MKKVLLVTLGVLLSGSSLFASITLSQDNFDKKVLKSKKPVIVKVYAPWCGACKSVGPIFNDLEKEMADQAVFASLSADDNQAIMTQYTIEALPTFIIFKNGKVQETIVGAMAKNRLKTKFENALK